VTDPEVQKKLLNKAGAILARRPHARGELRQKLLRHAEGRDVESVLDRLQDLKLLNDAEFAYNFAFHRAKVEGWGPLRIRQALLRRQVAPDIVRSTIERLRDNLADGSALQDYVLRHCRRSGLPQDRKGLSRLVAHLRRRGYHEDSIWAVLRQIIPAAVWQRDDSGD
jgi:regulatory protein